MTKQEAKDAIDFLVPLFFSGATSTIEDIIDAESFRLIQDFGDSLVLVENEMGQRYVLGGDGTRRHVSARLLLQNWKKTIERAKSGDTWESSVLHRGRGRA
jgi:hypothetical protein